MIRLEDVHKSFGGRPAVRAVGFSAGDGTVTGLLGPNGAGKTTTLRILGGLLRPDRGQVHIGGHDVARDPRAARRSLGLLPDARGLHPRLTPREHLRYAASLYGLSPAAADQRIEALSAQLGMAGIIDRRCRGFSQGERVKVALARALVHDPMHVVLDEPTNGLDVGATRAIRAMVRTLKEQGRCVVLSSHVMQEVKSLCSQLVILAEGEVKAAGTVDEVLAQAGTDDLEDAFVTLAGMDA